MTGLTIVWIAAITTTLLLFNTIFILDDVCRRRTIRPKRLARKSAPIIYGMIGAGIYRIFLEA